MNSKKLLENNYWIYGLAILSWIFIFFTLPTGFKTYVDEAFFVLGLNPAQELGIQHTQFFQMARFIFRVFHLESIVYTSRIVAFIINVLTLTIFTLASYGWLRKKVGVRNQLPLYASLVFLWGIFIYFAGYEMSFTFNHLHIFFVTTMLSCYLLWEVAKKIWLQWLLLVAMGMFSLLAMLNYVPAGVLITLTLLFLVLFKKRKNWEQWPAALLFFAGGVFLMALIYQTVIYPVLGAINEIVFSIRHPSFGTGSYELKDYLKQIIDYIGSGLIILLTTLGIAFLYEYNQRQAVMNRSKVRLILFLCVLGFIYIEQRVFRYNALLIPVVLTVIFYYLSKKPDFKKGLSLQQCALFLFPLIAIQGTNVDLIYKICYTAFLWVLPLSLYLFRLHHYAVCRFALYLSISLAIILGFGGHFRTHEALRGDFLTATKTIENAPAFKHIKLKEVQIEYFERVDSLLEATHFNPKVDRIMAFDSDYPVLLYLGVQNYGGLMHHPKNMTPYQATFDSIQNAPEYLIISQFEGYLLKKEADRFHWNYPTNCTEYELVNTGGKYDWGTGNRSLLVKKKQVK